MHSLRDTRRTGGLPSPRGHPGTPRSREPPVNVADAVRAAVAHEKRERAEQVDALNARLRLQHEENSELSRKMEAMQLTLQDFQVVLTSHEREVEGLWAQTNVRAPAQAVAVAAPGANPTELLDLQRLVAVLSDRVDAAESRVHKPIENLQASTMELLFTQNREFMDEFEMKLKTTQDQSLRDGERIDAQLAAIREALHLGDRQTDADFKGMDSRLHRAVRGLQTDAEATWGVLASALASPTLPIDSLGDAVTTTRASAVRDAILNAIALQVSQAVDVLRGEGDNTQKQTDALLKRVQGAVQRNAQGVETLAGELQDAGSGQRQQETLAMVTDLKAQVDRQNAELTTKLTAQHLNVVDIDRRLSEKVKGVGEVCGHLEGAVAKLNEDAAMKAAALGDLSAQVQAMRSDAFRSADEARAAALQFQEQCNDVLQRHIADVRERLQMQQEETRGQLVMAAEKGGGSQRACEQLRSQVEELAAAQKRAAAQLQELEAQRKDDARRLQQQTADSVVRSQQLMAADLNRVQKEISQEMQRYEDAASGLYRTVEELRGVQQRTLEEYHRQGDEQALVHAKFQQQLTDVNSILKESLQQESERLQNLLRGETQGLSDQLVRNKTELSERVGAVERRVGDTESTIDNFRGRIRTLEMNDSSKLEKTVFELKQATQQLENRLHPVEGWRNETVAKLTAMDGRISEAGNAAQLAQIQRKVEEVDRGLMLARGPEREEMRRQLKNDIEERATLLESRLDSGIDGLQMRVGDVEQLCKGVQRDRLKDGAQVQKNTEAIRRLSDEMETQLKKVKDSIASELEPTVDRVTQQIKQLQKDMHDTRDYCVRLDGLIKNRDTRAAEFASMMDKYRTEFDEMKEKFAAQMTKAESKMEDVQKFLEKMRKEFDAMRDELNTNSSEDEKREKALKDLIMKETNRMEKKFDDAFKKMMVCRRRQTTLVLICFSLTRVSDGSQAHNTQEELDKNSEEDERRNQSISAMVREYGEEFQRMRVCR